jgi:hypothetical protein
VWHSELNRHGGHTRFLQIWILPPARGLPVRYENHRFGEAERRNKLLHIVGSMRSPGDAPLSLNQDVNLHVSELTDPQAQVKFSLKPGRQAYINNFEGTVRIDGLPTLRERDALEVVGPAELTFSPADGHAHFIIIEMHRSRPPPLIGHERGKRLRPSPFRLHGRDIGDALALEHALPFGVLLQVVLELRLREPHAAGWRRRFLAREAASALTPLVVPRFRVRQGGAQGFIQPLLLHMLEAKARR